MHIPDPQLVSVRHAHLRALPPPLRLRREPILVSVETYNDNIVVARWPEAHFLADGRDMDDALCTLQREILAYAHIHAKWSWKRLSDRQRARWIAFRDWVVVPSVRKERR